MVADKNLKELLAKVVVAEYTSKGMVTHDSKSRVSDVVKTMSDRNVSSVAITENGRIVGILTERDVVKMVARQIAPETPAASLMRSSLVSIPGNSSLEKAAGLMAKNRVRHLYKTKPPMKSSG